MCGIYCLNQDLRVGMIIVASGFLKVSRDREITPTGKGWNAKMPPTGKLNNPTKKLTIPLRCANI